MQPTLSTRIPLYDLSFHIYVSDNLPGLGEVPGLSAEDLPGPLDVAQVSQTDVPSEVLESLGELGRRIILFIRPNASFNTITHESFHIAEAVFEYVAAPVSDGGGSEPFAYLIGWIAETVDKAIRSVRH